MKRPAKTSSVKRPTAGSADSEFGADMDITHEDWCDIPNCDRECLDAERDANIHR